MSRMTYQVMCVILWVECLNLLARPGTVCIRKMSIWKVLKVHQCTHNPDLVDTRGVRIKYLGDMVTSQYWC